QLLACARRHQPTQRFIECDCGERQTTVLAQIFLDICQNPRVFGLERLGENVGVQQSLVHVDYGRFRVRFARVLTILSMASICSSLSPSYTFVQSASVCTGRLSAAGVSRPTSTSVT